MKWAAGSGKQTELKKALFEAYFGKAANVSDPGVLAQCVEATYQQAGVSAVPAFIINNRYLISGAQEPETLVNAFREIASESEPSRS